MTGSSRALITDECYSSCIDVDVLKHRGQIAGARLSKAGFIIHPELLVQMRILDLLAQGYHRLVVIFSLGFTRLYFGGEIGCSNLGL
jgi:hypothetical protein